MTQIDAPLRGYAAAAGDRASAGLARAAAATIPALMIAYGFLIWPILFGEAVDTALSNFATANPGQDSNLVNQLYFPPLFLLAAFTFLIGSRRPLSALRTPAMIALALILALALTSTLWALDPGAALRRAILQTLIVGAVVLSLATLDEPRKALEPIFWLLVAIALVNLAAVATRPAGPLGHAGIYPQKNSLGLVSAFIALFMVQALFTGTLIKRAAALVILPACLFMLWASQSKTAFGLVFVVPVLSFAMMLVAAHARIAAGYALTLGFAAFIFFFLVGQEAEFWDFEDFNRTLFGDPTLTLRTTIWAFALEMIERRPLLGWGFESFWGVSFDAPSYREAPAFVQKMPHAHNGYIDMVLQLGLVGLATLIAFLVSGLNAIGRYGRRDMATGWLLCMIVVYMILQSYLETSWFRGFSGTSILFVAAIAIASLRPAGSRR